MEHLLVPPISPTFPVLGRVPNVRSPCPIELLFESAEPVLAHLVQALRQALSTRFPSCMSDAPARVAGYLEDGLALLLDLSAEPEFGIEQVEACRTLAQKDSRFQFIYRLPHSSGFGGAIGASIEQALFGESHHCTRTVTALLNIFMTVLDGLLDEVPQVIAPHWGNLLDLVCRGAAGEDVAGVLVPQDHPYNRLCFSIAKLWIRKLRENDGFANSTRLQGEFVSATRQAMLAEDAACDARFSSGAPASPEILYERTRWPHWCQALAAVIPHGWPTELHPDRFKDLIFRIGDYAAFLDDACDYLIDCRAGRWNTVSEAVYRRKRFEFCTPVEAQTRLLIHLADHDFVECVIETGLEIRASIEDSIISFGAPQDGLRALIADLTYVYLG